MTERQPIWSQPVPESLFATFEQRESFVTRVQREMERQRFTPEMVAWMFRGPDRPVSLQGFLEGLFTEYAKAFPEEAMVRDTDKEVPFYGSSAMFYDAEEVGAFLQEELSIYGCSSRMATWLLETSRGQMLIKDFFRRAARECVRYLPGEQEYRQKEDAVLLEQAVEYLGAENVHGPKDVERLLGFEPKEIPSIPYTLEDFQKSKKIKEKTGVEEMLVLFVGDKEGEVFTGLTLNELIQKRYTEKDLGQFLYKASWYKGGSFFTQDLGLKFEWKLVTKGCIPNSKNKHHDWREGDFWRREESQVHAIERYAKEAGLSVDELQRPDPLAMLYAVAIHLVFTEEQRGQGKGERVLEGEYHWSDVAFSGSCFVRVGRADPSGAYIDCRTPDKRYMNIGVCLSR